jgi:HAD superfamily hydrolase (TIGR01509 family)
VYSAILFDLDGTIIDTEANAAETVQQCFKNWGIAVDAADARFVTGRTWESAIDYLVQRYRLPVSRDQALAEILREYRISIEKNLGVVPGCVEAIRSLSSRYPLALVSGSRRADIEWSLTKLGVIQDFRFILGSEDYPRSKPAPDGYLKAIEILGVAATKTLIFEDSEAGIASGLAAGATVVAVTCTNHFQQDTSPAHHQILDLTQVTADWADRLPPRSRARGAARK